MAKSKFYLVSNFLSGIGAAHNMLADAIEQKRSFTEQVCLSATLIDGLLRLSLVMKRQLDTKRGIVDPVLLYQSKRQKKFISEKDVYKKACSEKVITKAIFKKLNALYNQRNIIVHRYIISDIKTKEVIHIAKQYIQLYLTIKEHHRVVYNILVNKNIGMARLFIVNPSDAEIHDQIMRKHF